MFEGGVADVHRLFLLKIAYQSKQKLKKIAQFVPENLPIHKALRIIQIDGFPAMPDGGTQVQNLVEIGPVEIVSLIVKHDRTILSYRLTNS